MNVIVLLADGVRPDTLANAMASGALPALARLRADGGMYDITSTFPSVTGAAYVPFLAGRFPGPAGLPGQRWFDRTRATCSFPGYSRSYVGPQLRHIDNDLDASARTVFELVPGSVGALSVITRGLRAENKVMALSVRSALRAAFTHFVGGARAMLTVDREISAQVVARAGVAPFLFAAFGGADKISHAEGHDSPGVIEALRTVDDTVAGVRAKLERAGRWADTRLWVSSDHGHSPVTKHEDLALVIAGLGHRVIAHPNVFRARADTAVMVSGNSMAHVYVDIANRRRPYLCGMSARARALVDRLTALSSVDLLLAAQDDSACVVRSATRGEATVSRNDRCYSYRRRDGDPLELGADLIGLSANDAHDACAPCPYPDAVVQIAELALAPRSGDIVLSAAAGWDFRARFEPVPHLSTHGALLREHMLVPFITSHVPARAPRRTADLMPSALAALGLPIPPDLDGSSFE